MKFDEKQVEEGRNFANKLWNAARYRQMQEGEPAADLAAAGLTIYAQDILTKLQKLDSDYSNALAAYKFNDAAQHLYEFFWSNFCDWYLESVKADFREDADPAAKAATLAVIDTVLKRFLPLLHPFMPHITEELWEMLGFSQGDQPIMLTELDHSPVPGAGSAETTAHTADVYEAVRKIRNLKAEYNLASSKDVSFTLKPSADWAAAEADTLALFSGAKSITVDAGYSAPSGTPAAAVPFGEVYMPLDGLIDTGAEKSRLGKELAKVEKEITKGEAKLANPNFVERAKPEAVAKAKSDLADWQSRQTQLQQMLANLG